MPDYSHPARRLPRFATAGAADIHYLESIAAAIGSLAAGNDGYVRALPTGGTAAAGGQLVYGFEALHNNGPWTKPEDFRKVNGALRYTQLVEDDSVRSRSSTIVNGHLAYRINRNFKVTLDAFNLFDGDADDITYYYASRLPGEAAGGSDDFHVHPAEPRSFRIGIVASF